MIIIQVTLDGGQLSDLEQNIEEQGWDCPEFPTWYDTKLDGSIVWHIEIKPKEDE